MKKTKQIGIKKISLIFLIVAAIEFVFFLLFDYFYLSLNFCFWRLETTESSNCADYFIIFGLFILTILTYLILLIGYLLNRYLKIKKLTLLIILGILIVILIGWIFWMLQWQGTSNNFNR